MVTLVVQTSLRIGAHKDDVNAVCFGEDSPNIIVTGSDDRLIKVRCSAATPDRIVAGASAVLCCAAVEAVAAAHTKAATSDAAVTSTCTVTAGLVLPMLFCPCFHNSGSREVQKSQALERVCS